MNYSQKLKDPRWQKMRLKIMERDNWSCRECGDATKPLNVHHLRYLNGSEPWEYPPEFLVTLCEDCHQQRHDEPPERSVASHLVTDFPLKNPGDEKFFGYIVGLGGNNLGEPNAQYFAIFDYGEVRTVQYLPPDKDLLAKLHEFLWQNLNPENFGGGIYAKLWIKKLATGWEIKLP